MNPIAADERWRTTAGEALAVARHAVLAREFEALPIVGPVGSLGWSGCCRDSGRNENERGRCDERFDEHETDGRRGQHRDFPQTGNAQAGALFTRVPASCCVGFCEELATALSGLTRAPQRSRPL